MAPEQRLRITVAEVHGESVQGLVQHEGGSAECFQGWLGLLQALRRVLDDERPAGDPR